MSNSKIRVRFAPSPTGPLHIGGVRTALYNYLFARKHGGDFLLRIEDTDQTRYVPGAEDYIVESLKWCGITIDEGVTAGGEYGPYRQSERKEMYKEYAELLVKEGMAYYAFDTPEELDAMRNRLKVKGVSNPQYDAKVRMEMQNSLTISDSELKTKLASIPYVIRFNMPENTEVKIVDIIRGEVVVNTSTLDDKILFKSDGMPTYHLANVVDDHLMKISHVIRGEEWLPSTPLHVLLYQALGWRDTMPEFAHLPLLLKPNGNGKLSKRDGDQMGFPVFPLEWKSPDGEISSGYRESGYFPEAFINMLALLGWNSGSEKEIFSLAELEQAFSLERVGKAGAKFDPEKAKWFNQQYLRGKSDNELAAAFGKILLEKSISADQEIIIKIVGLVKERVNFVHELWDQAHFFFEAPTSYDEKVIKKRWKENTPASLQAIANIVDSTEPFSSIETEEAVKKYISDNELNMGQIMNCLRLSLVGEGKGPHLFDIVEIIGKDETVARIKKAIEVIQN